MKHRLFTLALAVLSVAALGAKDLTGIRIYVNPGHGSFGPNDRPMATIPFPNLKSTGMPDTCGFYETNTNLVKCLYLGKRLEQAGATVVYSRTASGPWDYEKVNGEYTGYWWYISDTNPATHPNTTAYNQRSDYTKYNKNLSEICEEVEQGNFDLFISVHSNANEDGTTTNYPLWLYRGYDAAESDFEKTCKQIGGTIWPYRYEMMAAGYDPASAYSLTNMNLRGDVNFMGSGSESTRSNGNTYYGYYGVLKHGTPGGLYEGYFHTYQPARHRALNDDHCQIEGYGYYRGIIDWFGADKDTKGYILGTVKDLHEKISNRLFTYSPKTNDQWLPCNGATVKLLKDGKEIASYKVDSFYNGTFCFYDLEPGNYTLDASCEGYKPLSDTYKTPVKVEANKVTYPMIYLESESYEPPKVVYTDYPEPEMPDYVGVAGKYEMQQAFTDKAAEVLTGKKIHRVLMQSASSMFVLAFDTNEKGYIYQIDPQTMSVKQAVSTEGMTGELRTIGDIALTADSILIACNYTETQYSDTYVNEDSKTGKRGTFRVYTWDDLSAAPKELFNSQYSANWYGGNIGNSMTASGAMEDLTVITTCPTRSGSGVLRMAVFQVADGQLVSTMRNQDPSNAELPLTLPNYGWDLQLKPSPFTKGNFLLIGSGTGIRDITLGADAQAPIYNSRSAFAASGATFLRYAKHILMAVPVTEESKNAGVALYDVTAGLDKARLIKTTNSRLEAATAEYTLAATTVQGMDISLWLQRDDKLSNITTIGISQPITAHINAYGLKLASTDTTYTFTYTANSAAESTAIVFYQNGQEVGKVDVEAAAKGKNTAVIRKEQIPGFTGTPTTWAVELTGEAIGNWGQLHGQPKADIGMSRIFNAIDNNPENATFQHIYLADYVRNSANSGLYAVNPDYTFANTTPMLGGNALFGCLYRIAVDAEGYVYLPDWTDGNSGVYIANPADFSSFPNMFQGTRDGNGVISNNGVNVGSSTPAVHVYGKGKDTKLIVYNEDPGSTLVTNGLCIYNIGQEDGTIKRTWDTAPSKVLSIPGQLNSEGNVLGIERGIWVSQNRTKGNNNTSATSLQFFDWDGNRKFSSAAEPYKDIIIGSEGSAFALSADEKMLVLNDAEQGFMVFDIEWQKDNTPVLTLRYTYKHGYGVNNNNAFRQLSFDYAGNLIATGDPGFYVFSMPTDNNVTVVPANSSLTVEKPFSGHVEGVLLDKDNATLRRGETLTLTATVEPAEAANKNVTWTSSNEAVATVENGIVKAVSEGKATITVTTEEGQFTATCLITVNTPTGLEDLTESGVYYSNGILYNPNGLELTVFSVSGQLITTGNSDIYLYNTAAGMYIVRSSDNRSMRFIR
ncbi:MAG: Ig-like domain-containing protein [Paludibacteraceae bacterium]|nr:Ig-like domain-containing protein [Paludibacteraceae bacterium]